MTEPEIPNQPLLAAPSQQAALNTQGGRSSRAYKVAGLSLLACVLIVGQVVTAYLLLSQRDDIKSLKEQNSNLESEMTKKRSGGGSAAVAPVPMQRPMNALHVLLDDKDEEASTGGPEKTGTLCQRHAAGDPAVVRSARLPPDFRPVCDEKGRYQVQQCFMQSCWCVNPADGEMIPGTMSNGAARCNTLAHAGGLRISVSD